MGSITRRIDDLIEEYGSWEKYEEHLNKEKMRLNRALDTRSIEEVKKALYKEKPVAKRQLDYENGDWSYYTETSIGGINFRIPTSDMGDWKFGDNEPGQLLIRWIFNDEI